VESLLLAAGLAAFTVLLPLIIVLQLLTAE
jgi:hypothetical protein